MAKSEVLDKDKALKGALQSIEKQHGKGAVMKLTEVKRPDANSVPTGFIGLDVALGIGGVPRGRIIELFGPEGSGKSTLALEIMAAVQKKGGNAVYIDAEHALDPQYAENLGVDLDSMFVSQPDWGEQALAIADELVRSNAVDIIIIDSVAALTPKTELEGEMGDSHVALQARMMSQALRKLNAQINQTGTIMIFINQIREKVGGPSFGSNEVTPGGRALKFYSSLRLDVRKIETLKDGKSGEAIGHRCRISVKKNKVAPPFKNCELEIYYGTGFSREGSLLQEAINHGIVSKSGSWFSYDDVRLGQGAENARKYLEDNPAVMQELEKTIRESVFTYQSAEVEDVEDEAEDAAA